MSARISLEQRELAIEAIREHGTMNAGAKAAGVSVRTLNLEMQRSAIFKKRVLEAREEGHRSIADNAIEMIKEYASGNVIKTDRNVLTANIALANAYAPGFRGTTQVQGRIEHNVRVITAVPRPKYDEIDSPKVKVIDITYEKDKERLKRLNAGKPVDTIEGAIEEVAIEDKKS